MITYQIGTILPRVYSTLVMATPPYLGGDTAASGRRYHASRFVNHHRNRVDQEHGLALPLTRYKFITSPTEQLTTLDEFKAAVIAVLNATAATNAAIKSEPGEPNLGWDPSRNQWGSPFRDRFP